jgi:uncharacterized damage-inducible protein DinB
VKIAPDAMLKMYQYCADLMLLNLQGITHEQSLYQPAAGVNSINWLIGHLISSRTRILACLGQPAIWSGEQRARYRNGSDVIAANGPGVMQMDSLVRDYRLSHEATIIGFHGITPEHMDDPSDFRGPTIADTLLYLQFHEAHHIGQIMSVREHLGLSSSWLT